MMSYFTVINFIIYMCECFVHSVWFELTYTTHTSFFSILAYLSSCASSLMTIVLKLCYFIWYMYTCLIKNEQNTIQVQKYFYYVL